MPQVKSKNPAKTRKDTEVPKQDVFQRPSLADAGELIGRMYNYEETALKQGIDLSASRFKKLTESERQFIRAELVADYVRLSAGNTGKTPCYFDDALESFCAKICDMGIPSHELIGTYLAALDVVSTDDHLSKVAWLHDAVRRTMVQVLQSCVDLMQVKTDQATQYTV